MIALKNMKIGQTYTIITDKLLDASTINLFNFSLKRDYIINSLYSEKNENPFKSYRKVIKNFWLYTNRGIEEYFKKYKININKAKFTIVDKKDANCTIEKAKIIFVNETTINNVERIELIFDKPCFAKAIVNDNNKSLLFFLFDIYKIGLYLDFSKNIQALNLYGYIENNTISLSNQNIKNNILLLIKECLLSFKENDYYRLNNTYILNITKNSEMYNRLNNKAKTILEQIATQVNEIVKQNNKRWNYLNTIPFKKYK